MRVVLASRYEWRRVSGRFTHRPSAGCRKPACYSRPRHRDPCSRRTWKIFMSKPSRPALLSRHALAGLAERPTFLRHAVHGWYARARGEHMHPSWTDDVTQSSSVRSSPAPRFALVFHIRTTTHNTRVSSYRWSASSLCGQPIGVDADHPSLCMYCTYS